MVVKIVICFTLFCFPSRFPTIYFAPVGKKDDPVRYQVPHSQSSFRCFRTAGCHMKSDGVSGFFSGHSGAEGLLEVSET